MLWSPTQQKIYSVGKDRYDDGGEGSFDISVPAIISPTSGPKETKPPAPNKRTNRHEPLSKQDAQKGRQQGRSE
jgi:hypothetical protein